MRPVKEVRLFFALWPDQDVRNQVFENLKRVNLDLDQCRLVAASNIHLTLHFVGNTSIAEMKCMDVQARLVNADPFKLTLDYSGYFKKPKVLWFGCQAAPQQLFKLQRSLGQRIAQCAYEPESRPYSPHLTVARKVNRAPESTPFDPVHWAVNRFVLVESISISGEVRYEVVNSFPLPGD